MSTTTEQITTLLRGTPPVGGTEQERANWAMHQGQLIAELENASYQADTILDQARDLLGEFPAPVQPTTDATAHAQRMGRDMAQGHAVEHHAGELADNGGPWNPYRNEGDATALELLDATLWPTDTATREQWNRDLTQVIHGEYVHAMTRHGINLADTSACPTTGYRATSCPHCWST